MKKIEKPLKKERVDTAVKKEDVSCFPLVVSANNVETVVLLLDTVENEILIQALRSLSKYGSLSIENVEQLYSLKVLPILWRYLDHLDLAVRRYSLKLMAQVYDAFGALDILLKDDEGIMTLLDILLKNKEDKFIQEFTALIFAKLTTPLEGCDKVIHTELISMISPNLSSSDPDVRKNYLQILTNILKDPEGSDIVAASVNWILLYPLLKDRYVDIQTLDIEAIDKLLCRQKDNLLHESFKKTNGLAAILDVLETYSLKHLHPLILDLLKNYSQTDETISNFYESGCLTRFIQYLELAPLEEKPRCMAVFLKIALNKKGREMLHMCNVEDVICNVLSDTEMSLWGLACQAATLMCRYCRSAGIMVDKDIVVNVLSIIQNNLVEWEHDKEDAVLLLAELFRVEKRASSVFIELKGHLLLRKYLDSEMRADITQKGIENIIQCFINMEAFQDTRNLLMEEDFFRELMNILQEEDLPSNKIICEVLCGLMVDYQGKEFFIANKGVQLVHKLLEDETDGIKEATCRLIILSVDEDIAEDYIQEGILHLLTLDRKKSLTCPIWKSATDAILKYHLPAKFSYNKLLNFDDVTDDFYAIKEPPFRFPDFFELMEDNDLPKRHVYYCHFVNESEFDLTSSVNEALYETLDSAISVNNANMSLILNDHHLTEYLREIQNTMIKTCLHYGVPLDIKDKIQILGEFVGKQMCGPDPSLICNNHLIDLHLHELGLYLRSKILPLGLVRVGGAFERALLFKVLADKMEIPAKLCSDIASHAWIEVPVLNAKDFLDERLMVNWHLLKSSHVVDLLEKPGSLLPLGSPQAALYCHIPVQIY